jgi:AcrR family transcriptional regulator
MQEIADEAGINKAMLHYCFKNKQLFWSSVHECLQPIVAPNQYYF